RPAGGPAGGSSPAIGRIHAVHLYRRHSGHALARFARLARERSRIVARQHERERRSARRIDRDVTDHPRRHDVAPVPWIGDGAERPLYRRLRGVTHFDGPFPRQTRAARNTFSSTSAMVPASDAPAARWWPPPPNGCANAATSTSRIERNATSMRP